MISPPAASQISRDVCPGCGSHLNHGETVELGCPVCLLRGALEPINLIPAEVPESLGGYVIVRHDDGSLWELGRGAMGITYRAQDLSLERQVALKVINADFTLRGAEARARFTREARAAAALRHPNVATIHQFGIDEQSGHSFYAMELVEGETLEERVRGTGPLDLQTVVEIARQVTSALAAAEQRRLVHRDLKPGNLMVSTTPGNEKLTVKVIDFGLAKALAETPDARILTAGGFVGTPAFASPEQLDAKPVDIRSDIYSLGATLWYLLTGRMPFGDASGTASPPVEQLKAAHVPPRLISLLISMLAREPAARPSVPQLERQLETTQERLDNRRKAPIAWALAVAIAMVVTVAIVWSFRRAAIVPALPEKSIAVLPFTTLVVDEENTFIADALQEDILTQLAKVRDLKVIGRRSVAQYRSGGESIRDIGRALQVAYILEGTVHKVGDKVRITTQLIDAQTEAEKWGETYERSAAGVLGIENQILQMTVSQLKVAVSRAQAAALEKRPTKDDQAYDFYLRARTFAHHGGALAKVAKGEMPKAIPLLESAIARDPKFTLAYCLLSEVQLALFQWEYYNYERLPKAEAAAKAAIRLSPESGESHLAMARYLSEGIFDRKSAEKELALAARSLRGDVNVLKLRADFAEADGQWRTALEARRKALELEPRDVDMGSLLVELYIGLRWYAEAERLCDQMISTLPQQTGAAFWRRKAWSALARGDIKSAMSAYESFPYRDAGLTGIKSEIGNILFLERQYDKAAETVSSSLDAARANKSMPQGSDNPAARGARFQQLGTIVRVMGQAEKAGDCFTAARTNNEAWLARNPAQATIYEARAAARIAAADAALGQKEEALKQLRHVLQLWPPARNAVVAAEIAPILATAYLWAGEREDALRLLERFATVPNGPTAAELKFNPVWDELRGDPRFQKLIAEAAKPISL